MNRSITWVHSRRGWRLRLLNDYRGKTKKLIGVIRDPTLIAVLKRSKLVVLTLFQSCALFIFLGHACILPMKQMPWWNTYFLRGFLPMVLVTTVCCWLSCWRLLALVTTVDEAALGGGIVTGPVPGMGADCPEWLWVVWCFFNSRRSRYPLEQTAHTKGFSPVWIRTCVTYLSRLKNPLPQVSHL